MRKLFEAIPMSKNVINPAWVVRGFPGKLSKEEAKKAANILKNVDWDEYDDDGEKYGE